MKTLIITEKPSVAIDIAKILGGFSRKDGYLESPDKIISWAVGHLVQLVMPQEYNTAYEKWDMDNLPILPQEFKLEPKKSTIKQLMILKELVKRNDVTSLINACDAGREGELIFRYTMQYLNCTKPHKRLWLAETTDVAVLKAFNSLKEPFDNLGKAAVARSQADWLIGINATRAYTVKHREKLSVGRVQTPTLAILVTREQEITNFIPQKFYEIEADFGYPAKWYSKDTDRFENKTEAEAVLKKFAKGDTGVVTATNKETKESAPSLLNLNDLQKLANKQLGLTATETLDIAQKLYEQKLITYPRTDSRHLTSALADTVPSRLKALAVTELAPLLAGATENISANKKYVDDAKVTDHAAVIITDNADISNLNAKEKEIYLLIARRTLAIFYPPAVINKIEIITTCNGETFITKENVVIVLGWRKVITETEEQKTIPLNLPHHGAKVALQDINILEKETTPLKRLTEGDLLSAMENVNKRIKDAELKEVMVGKGLGTPATRANIIEKLVNTGYIERSKKILIPTEKGKELINIVSEKLKSPEITAEWEHKLLEIEKGNYSEFEFMKNIKKITEDIITEVKNMEVKKEFNQTESIGVCPICGNVVTENKKAFGCSDWKNGCKFTIWKEIAGKKISKTQAKKLIIEGKTGLIKGFKSKKGNNFDAYLIYSKQDNRVEFEFIKN